MTTFDPTIPATQEEANSLALTVENLRAENERLQAEVIYLRDTPVRLA